VEISSSQFADVVVAAPVGRIDHRSAAALEAFLSPLVQRLAAAKEALVLDFTGVDYISSVGLRALMIASKQMRGAGGRIAVTSLQPVVAEIFSISRFDRVIDVHPSVAAALGQLSPAAASAHDAADRPPART